MGSSCFNCNKSPPCLKTEDGKKQSCLHCAINCIFNSKWTILDSKALSQQIDEEVVFLKAIKKHVKAKIAELKTGAFTPYEELIKAEQQQIIHYEVKDYINGLYECYQSHVSHIIFMLNSLLHTYKIAYTIFTTCDKEKLDDDNLYSFLRSLKWYKLFKIDPNDPLKPIISQKIYSKHFSLCKLFQEVTLSKAIGQANATTKGTVCFRKNDELEVFKTDTQTKEYFPLIYPFEEAWVYHFENSVICGNKLFLANSRDNFLIYTNIQPLIMIKKARRSASIYGRVLVALNEKVVYVLAPASRQLCSEKMVIAENCWRLIPKLTTTVAINVACTFMERYLYAFVGKETVERLDTMEEERGWEVIRIACGILKPTSALQYSDGEILILGRGTSIIYELLTNKTRKVKLSGFNSPLLPKVVNGKIYTESRTEIIAYSLLTRKTTHLEPLGN